MRVFKMKEDQVRADWTNLINRNAVYIFSPERLVIDSREAVDLVPFHDSKIRAIISGGSGLHCACALRPGFLRVFIYKAVEEVRKRVQGQIGICSQLLFGEQLRGMELDGRMEMGQKRCLDIACVSVDVEREEICHYKLPQRQRISMSILRIALLRIVRFVTIACVRL